MKAQGKPVVYAVKGSGSLVVEIVFSLADVDYTAEHLTWEELTSADGKVNAMNPLRQTPTVSFPDGSVMTETAAIALWVHGTAPDIELLPAKDPRLHREYLRWLIWIASAVYPTFTYGDDPGRFVEDAASKALMRRRTDELRKRLWSQLEEYAAATPRFREPAISILDVYAYVMSHWRPGRKWFETRCPTLFGASEKVGKARKLEALLDRNQGAADES